jgi:phosphatidylserine/phosphatidylglycerophosphate/cardiolipin synthase-like enzyme
MKQYTFLSRSEYFTALINDIARTPSGQRVYLVTMGFDPNEPLIEKILHALNQAAQRGVHVVLLIDAINFLVNRANLRPGPLFFNHSFDRLRGKYALCYAALEALRIAGGSYRIVNIPTKRIQLPFAGRSHIKSAVIGGRVYVGGCNLEDAHQIDVMVRWEDKKIANRLSDWFARIAESGDVRKVFGDVDLEVALDNSTQLLVDAGVPRQSLIYEEALRLIDEAQQELYMTCQFFPGGTTAKHLAIAQKRGVQIRINYSHPQAHKGSAPLQYIHQFSQRVQGVPASLFTNMLPRSAPKLHAKILASERAVLVGSHNYVTQGVQFGTAEIALCSTDPIFIQALKSFVQQELVESIHLAT